MGRWQDVDATVFAQTCGFDAEDPEVARFWCELQTALPALTVESEVVMRSLRELRLRRPDPSLAGDLLLAIACVSGDPAAIEMFERTIVARLGPSLARIDSRSEIIDEACQLVRARLLVHDQGRPPRLSAYRGEAPLWVWVKTIAVRVMVDLARAMRRERTSDETDLEGRLVSSGAIDLAVFRERHRPAVVKALSASLRALDARQRNLLRLAYVDGLSVDRIGLVYGTSRASAARWVASAREALRTAVHRALAEELELGQAELDSFFSNLDFSLDRSLRVFFDGLSDP